jgi:hypothetical protein
MATGLTSNPFAEVFMKKPLLITLILFVAAFPAYCQNSNEEEIRVRPAEAVEHTRKPPTLFERLFKKRREPERESRGESEASPTPSRREVPTKRAISAEPPTKKAIPTEASETLEEPAPTPAKRRRKKPAPEPTPSEKKGEATVSKSEQAPSPEPESTPETGHKENRSDEDNQSKSRNPEAVVTPEPESTPAPEKKANSSPLWKEIPFVPTPEPEVAKRAPDLLDPSYVKWMNDRYNEVRAKALEDKKVSALKDQADGVFEPAERANALKVYYKALFKKMREIDSSLKVRIDGREEATMRRIEALAPAGE